MRIIRPTRDEIKAIIEAKGDIPFLGAVIGFYFGYDNKNEQLLTENGEILIILNQNAESGNLELQWGTFKQDPAISEYLWNAYPDISTLRYNALNSQYSHFISNAVASKPYYLYICAGAVEQTPPPTDFQLATLTMDDIETIKKYQTVDYPTAYLQYLVTSEPFSQLNAVLRHKGKAVSWCLTHSDFSVGLIGTVQEYQKRGLAKIVLSSVLNSYQKFCKDNGMQFSPYSFAATDNMASMRLLASCGLENTMKEYIWFTLSRSS